MVQQSKKARVKIEAGYFYFIDLKDPLNPGILKDRFKLKVVAKSCLRNKLGNKKRYHLVDGELILKYRKDLRFIKLPYSKKVIKHDYRKIPIFSDPSKKRLRTINRRRLRKEKAKEWGLKPPKYEYDYPEGCVTERQRKSYREWIRRKFYKQINYRY